MPRIDYHDGGWGGWEGTSTLLAGCVAESFKDMLTGVRLRAIGNWAGCVAAELTM